MNHTEETRHVNAKLRKNIEENNVIPPSSNPDISTLNNSTKSNRPQTILLERYDDILFNPAKSNPGIIWYLLKHISTKELKE